MKSLFKRILCVAIALCMMLQPVAYVQAEGEMPENEGRKETAAVEKKTEKIPVYINPLYEDVLTEEDIVVDLEGGIATLSDTEVDYETDVNKLVETIRQTMVARGNMITLYYATDQPFDENWFGTWFEEALAETSDSHEGDYLRWNFAGYGGGESGVSYFYDYEMEQYCYTYNIEIAYYTDAEQEEAVDAKLETVLWGEDELNLDDGALSDYEKTKAIYDYICSNVEYDYKNLNDDTNKLKFTAYAALINNTAVCQGYSALLYRMLEEAGVDARMVTGLGITSDGAGGHAWNLSEIDGTYYYSDSTWDAGVSPDSYEYFLEGNEKFTEDHTPDEESLTYLGSYDISKTAYTPDENTGSDDETGGTDSDVTANSPTINSISLGTAPNRDMNALTSPDSFTIKMNVTVPEDSEFSGIQLDYARYEDGSIMTSQGKIVNIYANEGTDSDGEEGTIYEATVDIEEYNLSGEYKLHQIWVYNGDGCEIYERDGDSFVFEGKVVSYSGDVDFTILPKENEDRTEPVLKSIERVSEDKDAPIYTDTPLSYEMGFTDDGGSGLRSVTAAFKNVETEEEIDFTVDIEESGFTDGTITLESTWETRGAGTYKLWYIQISDYSRNTAPYFFEYDDDGMVIPYLYQEVVEGLSISDYEFTVVEGTEAAQNYNNVVLKSISVENQTVHSEEKVVANVTVFNPTENAIDVYPEQWHVEWLWPITGETGSFWSAEATGDGEVIELEAGEEASFKAEYQTGKYDSSGKRTLAFITYKEEIDGEESNIIQYYVLGDSLIGENTDNVEVHRIGYLGECDFVYENENAEEIAPVINNIGFTADTGEDGIIYNDTDISLNISCTEGGASGIEYASVSYRNEKDEIEEFSFWEEEGELVGDNIVQKVTSETRSTGKYKLTEIYIRDYARNSVTYSFSYTEDETPMVSINGADAVEMSTLWPDMESSYNVVAKPYEGVKIKDIRLSKETDSLKEEDTFDVILTLKNDTEQEMIIDNGDFSVNWTDDTRNYYCHFSKKKTVIEAGETAEISTTYEIPKYISAGERKLEGIEYYNEFNGIDYSYNSETGNMIGQDNYGNKIDSWEYDGSADWNVQEAPNVDTEAPIIKSFKVIKEVETEEDTEAIVALQISDEGNAPLTYVWFWFEDVETEGNYHSYHIELDSSMKHGDTYEIPLTVYDDMIAATYMLNECEIEDDAGHLRSYYRNDSGELVEEDEEGSVISIVSDVDDLIIQEATCKDTDFAEPVFENITFDSKEIKAGGVLSGEVQVTDESGLSEMELSFYDSNTDQYMDLDDIELEKADDVYKFEAAISKYVVPGTYELESMVMRDDSAHKNYGWYDYAVEMKDTFMLTVQATDGIVMVDGSDESYENALEQVKEGDVVAVDVTDDNTVLPASFLQGVKDKGASVVIPSVDNHPGEMILDPDNEVTEYTEDIVAYFWSYERSGEPELCEELEVDSYIPVGGELSSSTLPIKIRVKGLEQENVTYCLYEAMHESGEGDFTLIQDELQCKDGFVEIDFPQGIGNGVSTLSSASYVHSFYYYIGIKHQDECTEHVSSEMPVIGKNSTCYEQGYQYYECVNCGMEIEGTRESLDFAEHTWGEWSELAAPTCTEPGSRTRMCTVAECEKEDTEVIKATGHKYGEWITDKAATCTATGSRHKVCTVCEHEVPETIAKLAHKWNSGVITAKATCEKAGTKVYTCSSCRGTRSETIKATGHKYKITKTKKATTKKNGKLTKKCTVCAKSATETLYRAKSISLSKTKFVYNGKSQKPKVTVKDSKGRVISSSNYKVSYSKGCKNAGTYKVTVKFKGQYSGKLTKSFKITKAKQVITANNFTKKKGDKAFSIKAKRSSGGGKLTYKTSNKKVVTVSKKGKVTIKKAGKATITITAAANKNYKKATKKITVTVNPK